MTILDYRSPPSLTTEPIQPRGHWLGWAIYLAMSWTWCIGMFLPVLLVRDFGIWGWVVFAIPNVLGAAAMGWIIRETSSLEMVSANRGACNSFSLVTIAFHAYFLFWIILPMLGLIVTSLLLALATVTFLLVRRSDYRSVITSIAAFAISSMLFVWGIWRRELPYLRLEEAKLQFQNLPWLGLTCLYGFSLCPYLDQTFHRARQNMSKRGARAAFSLGFGLLFLSMIVFTLSYTGWLMRFGSAYYDISLPRFIAGLIGTHFLMQSALTVGLHAREIPWTAARALVFAAAIACGFIVLIRSAILQGAPSFLQGKYNSGELVYRLFLGFYGLVFPAYVWLCMIPGKGRIAPTERQWIVFISAVVFASPMFWLGFIESEMTWLPFGLAVVLLARLFIGGVPSHGEQARPLNMDPAKLG